MWKNKNKSGLKIKNFHLKNKKIQPDRLLRIYFYIPLASIFLFLNEFQVKITSFFGTERARKAWAWRRIRHINTRPTLRVKK